MIHSLLTCILLSLSGGEVSSVNDVYQDLENIARIIVIGKPETITDEDN